MHNLIGIENNRQIGIFEHRKKRKLEMDLMKLRNELQLAVFAMLEVTSGIYILAERSLHETMWACRAPSRPYSITSSEEE